MEIERSPEPITNEDFNPTTQFASRCSLDSYSSVCVKGTPDDFEAGSIEQAKWPFRYQMFSSARLLAAAA